MTASVDPSVLNFIPEIINEIASDPEGSGGSIGSDSTVITFGESFFDQFFAGLGHSIDGFSTHAKRQAIRFVEGLTAGGRPTDAVRRIVVSYEEFCDLALEIRGNYSDSAVRYGRAVELIQELLTAIEPWWLGELGEEKSKQEVATMIQHALSLIEDVR